MINLAAEGQKLLIVVDADTPPATNDLDWIVNYTRGALLGQSDNGASTGTMQQVIVENNTGQQVRVFSISVYNRDIGTRTVTIVFNDGTNDRNEFTAELQPGWYMKYTDMGEWHVLSDKGVLVLITVASFDLDAALKSLPGYNAASPEQILFNSSGTIQWIDQ